MTRTRGMRLVSSLGLAAIASTPSCISIDHEALRGPHRIERLGAEDPLEIGPEGWTSPWMQAPWIFNEFLPSWNVDLPEHAAFRVEVRAASSRSPHETPWLDLGGWGAWPESERAPIACEEGAVAIDLLRLDVVLDRVQVRLRTRGLAAEEHVVLQHLFGVYSQWWSPQNEWILWPPFFMKALEGIPQRRQTDEAPELAPRICGPTSLAMVLEHHGIDVSTEEVARLCYDAENDIYGNWNRAIQAASQLGLPGTLWRVGSWIEAWALLDGGHPLVISIGVEPGQLTGAPYECTAGHLLVLCGIEDGHALVLDPAVPPGEVGVRRYDLDELEECWLRRGGFAYVFFPKPEPPTTRASSFLAPRPTGTP